MNNPEKVVHAKKYPQTSFYRSLFAFYEQLLKVRVKKKSLFLSGTREKTGKKCHLLVERESPIFGVPAHSSLFIFWVPRWARLFTVLQLPLTYSQNEQVNLPPRFHEGESEHKVHKVHRTKCNLFVMHFDIQLVNKFFPFACSIW